MTSASAWRPGRRPAVCLWDLDGAMIDSSPGIFACQEATVQALGLPPFTPAQQRAFIGPPLIDGFRQLTPDDDLAWRAVETYRAEYGRVGTRMFSVQPGVAEVVSDLHAAGVTQVIATSKTEHFAQAMADHAGFTQHLWRGRDGVFGASADLSVRTKPEIVGRALATLAAAGVAGAGAADGDVVMIGDRSHDVTGAAAHGVPCIGVDWGFAEPGELNAAGAAVVCADAAALRTALGLA